MSRRRGCVACASLLTLLVSACVQAPPPKAVATSKPVKVVHTAGEPVALAGITDAHNRVRARVGAPPLRWSATLAETATRWANTCVDNQSPRGLLDHSPQPKNIADGPLGENIYATTARAADPIAAVQDWASEAVYYDQKLNTCSGGACGHYTQLVWSATREVGCGVGSCPRLKYPSTLVCNYSPVGNVIGQRPYP